LSLASADRSTFSSSCPSPAPADPDGPAMASRRCLVDVKAYGEGNGTLTVPRRNGRRWPLSDETDDSRRALFGCNLCGSIVSSRVSSVSKIATSYSFHLQTVYQSLWFPRMATKPFLITVTEKESDDS
jgi:hypothetical protein